jgi:predicted phage terminase large subunit-like protein
MATLLAGYVVHFKAETGNKVVRAGPVASQAAAGNVCMVRAPWNEELLRRLHAFPTAGVPDDDVDALSSGYNELHPTVPHLPTRALVAPVVSPFAL